MDNILKLKKEFDWKFYVERYPDLQEAGVNTPENALKHYCHFGKREGRVFSNKEVSKPVPVTVPVPVPVAATVVFLDLFLPVTPAILVRSPDDEDICFD